MTRFKLGVRDPIKLLTDEVAIELGLDSKSYSKAIAHTIRGGSKISCAHIGIRRKCINIV